MSDSVQPAELVPAVPASVFPGQVIGDRYVIGSVIGEGGMGVVCIATHLYLGTPVAVKLIRADLQHDPESIARFLNEARAAAALKGEHVARVYDFGQLPSGEPYLVMEHLEGLGLDAFLAERGPLAQSEAVDIVLQACEGLAEAHAVSLVHRDIKAANLFLARRPDGQFVLKILDFGIAKRLMDGALNGLTNPRTSIGSPWYMPPEQMLDSTTVDQRADVWSLGVLLYELLTQAYPFNGDGVVQVCANVLTAPTPSLLASRPDVDAELDRVVQRCLEKKMERRFASVIELADALRPFGSRPALPTSALAPSEGLNLDPVHAENASVEVEVPLETWPPEPIVNATSGHENATLESWAPMTVQRRQGFRKRHRARAAPGAKRSASLLVATAILASLFGVGLSWLSFPYLQARYGAPDLRKLVGARLNFEPTLNPGPAPAPRDRTLGVPEFVVVSSTGDTSSAPPRESPPLKTATASPTLTPAEIQRRAERYARWLREQGLTPLNGEWTASEGSEPRQNPQGVTTP